MKMEVRRGCSNINMFMRKQVRKDESMKVLNGSGCTVSDNKKWKKKWKNEVESFGGKLFGTNGNAALGIEMEMIGDGMTSGEGGCKLLVSRR